MTVIIATLVGFVAGRMLWLALRNSWQREAFMRHNFNGVSLPTAAGIVLPLALVVVEAGRGLAGGFGIGDEPIITAPRAAALIAVVGFAMLGLLDDLAGSTDVRGFAGHIKALAKGRLTSGGVKLLGGAMLSVVTAVLLVGEDGGGAILVAAAIIALSANLINLFDLRPGRAGKVALAAFVAIAVVSLFDTALVPVAVTLGAAAALLFDDLRQRLMLGDTGANAMGAAIGIGLITQLGTSGRVVALVMLIALNLASEFVSFSKIIDSVGPLRAFDQLGRKTRGQAPGGTNSGIADPGKGPEAEPMVDIRDSTSARPATSTTRVSVDGAQEPGSPLSRQQTPAPAKQERPFASQRLVRRPPIGGASEDDTSRW